MPANRLEPGYAPLRCHGRDKPALPKDIGPTQDVYRQGGQRDGSRLSCWSSGFLGRWLLGNSRTSSWHFKNAFIERALGAELNQNPGYAPQQAKADGGGRPPQPQERLVRADRHLRAGHRRAARRTRFVRFPARRPLPATHNLNAPGLAGGDRYCGFWSDLARKRSTCIR